MPKSSTRRPPSILDSILAETPTGAVTDEELVQGIESNFTTIPGGYLIPIERVEPWERQPRRFFDEEQLAMLARSIADAGLLEPLIVRRDPKRPGHYIIVAGHRRLLACRRLHSSGDPAKRGKVAVLPSIVREIAEDAAFADALVENLVRTDLTRKETLDAVAQLQREYRWSGHQIANRTGRNPSDINTLLRIAKHLVFYRLVSDERINPSVAGILMRLSESGQDAAIKRLERDKQWIVTADDARRLVDNERIGQLPLDDRPSTTSPEWVNSPTRGAHGSLPGSGRHTDAPASAGTAPERQAVPTDNMIGLPPDPTHQMLDQSEEARARGVEVAASSTTTDSATAPQLDGPAAEATVRNPDGAGASMPGDHGEIIHVSTHTRRKPGADRTPALQIRRSDGDVEDFARYILAWARESAPLTPGQRTLVADTMAQVRDTLGLPSGEHARYSLSDNV
jgi:ParB/RepB/Spo0J family partition protein